MENENHSEIIAEMAAERSLVQRGLARPQKRKLEERSKQLEKMFARRDQEVADEILAADTAHDITCDQFAMDLADQEGKPISTDRVTRDQIYGRRQMEIAKEVLGGRPSWNQDSEARKQTLLAELAEIYEYEDQDDDR